MIFESVRLSARAQQKRRERAGAPGAPASPWWGGEKGPKRGREGTAGQRASWKLREEREAGRGPEGQALPWVQDKGAENWASDFAPCREPSLGLRGRGDKSWLLQAQGSIGGQAWHLREQSAVKESC